MSDEKKRRKLINLKVNADEYEQMAKNAETFEGGNMSRWLRNRGLTVESVSECYEEVEKNEQTYEESDAGS